MSEKIKLETKTKTEFDVFDIVKIKQYSNDNYIVIGKLLCHSQNKTSSKRQNNIDIINSFYEIKYIIIDLNFFKKNKFEKPKENLITDRKEVFDLIFNILYDLCDSNDLKHIKEKISKKCLSRINLILKNLPTLESASVFSKQIIRSNSNVFIGMFLENEDMIKARVLLIEKIK